MYPAGFTARYKADKKLCQLYLFPCTLTQYENCVIAGGVKYAHNPCTYTPVHCMYNMCVHMSAAIEQTQVCSVSSTVNKTILYTNSNG